MLSGGLAGGEFFSTVYGHPDPTFVLVIGFHPCRVNSECYNLEFSTCPPDISQIPKDEEISSHPNL